MSHAEPRSTTQLDPEAFAIHRMTVRDDVELAFVREGVGGLPLVLIHGWPSTKRLFWRNIRPLAEAGFEVIVPDQRGFGDSPKPSTYVDIAASARDIHALVTGLGHDQVIAAGGDFGSGVVQDLTNRFPGFVQRQAIWNGIPPAAPPEVYEAAGVGGNLLQEVSDLWSGFQEHGLHADRFAAQLDTEEKRLAYVRTWYAVGGARVWREGHDPIRLTSPGAFDEAATTFMSEPFGNADSFRSSLGFYEGSVALFLEDEGVRRPTEVPLLSGDHDVETLVLFGVQDNIVGINFARRAAVGFRNLVGPFLIDGSGHFVQFEKSTVFNRALTTFCRDLLRTAG